MLDDIRFTMPAVAKKGYVQDLTHFRVSGGRLTGYDGVMALSSTIGVDLDVRPNAAKFLAAVRACEGTVALYVTKAGRLAVEAGRYRAYVECLDADGLDPVQPEGQEVELGETFLRGVRLLSPVMGVDASRPWAMGIKVCGQSMYATNNVIVAQYWHGSPFPHDVVIPARAVTELLRIGTAPTRVQVTEGSVTFWFGEERWLRTNLLEGRAWPIEKLEGAMDGLAGDQQVTLPDGMFEDLVGLKPFLGEDPAVFLRPSSISTSREEGVGASISVALSVPDLQSYSYHQLEILGQVATAVDWRGYPGPCMFTHAGEPLRGLMVGRRL